MACSRKCTHSDFAFSLSLPYMQVLVKKSYGDKHKRHKLRNWQLQQLDREMEATNQENYERDYTEFLEDLEEDKQFRQNVDIYFSKL